MTMFNTLLLDQTAWDLVEDAAGNIAMAAPPYALAQDVASAVRLFLAECWYDTTKGIPYWDDVLGQLPPSSLLVELIRKAALSVPGVVAARCIIQSFAERNVTGQVQFTDESGATTVANF